MHLPFITIPSMTAISSLYDSIALCLGAVGLLWQANLILYYFVTILGAHSASLLVGSVIWTYNLGCQLCFVWHLPLCPSLVLAHPCFPCGYDGTANPQ